MHRVMVTRTVKLLVLVIRKRVWYRQELLREIKCKLTLSEWSITRRLFIQLPGTIIMSLQCKHPWS